MALNNVTDWSTSRDSNIDIGGHLLVIGDMQPLSHDERTRELMKQIASWRNAVDGGHLYGLTLSNNASDATNDIDIAAGTARDSTNADWLVLAAAITKRLDAAWAVGTNQGGLDTGSIANTTYHVWLIKRTDTGVVDVLFSTSASAPTMPTNYTLKRRIGSIIRESAAIVVFKQNGDVFTRAPATDRNSTSAAASALLALSVPAGINVQPLLEILLVANASSNVEVNLGTATTGSANIRAAQAISGTTTEVDVQLVPPQFLLTNTSRQIYYSAVATAGTFNFNTLRTFGWIDRRGVDA